MRKNNQLVLISYDDQNHEFTYSPDQLFFIIPYIDNCKAKINIEKILNNLWGFDNWMSYQFSNNNNNILEIIIELSIKDSKLKLKNYYIFVGLAEIKEKQYIINSDESLTRLYAKEKFINLEKITFFIENSLNLRVAFLYSPTTTISQLYNNKISKNAHYRIKVNKLVLNEEQFIYKYFLYLKKFLKINLTQEHFSSFSYLINYNFIMQDHIYLYFNKEGLKYTNKSLQIKVNKLLLQQNKKFFENVLYFLENDNNAYNYKQEDSYAKKWLFGGRLEIYNNVQYIKPHYSFVTFDFPNAYFNEIKTNKFPMGELYLSKEFKEDTDEIGFVDCNVSFFSENLPVLPVRYNDRVVYPKGRFSGVWFSEELKLFLKQGGKVNTINMFYYWKFKENRFDYFCKNLDNLIKEEKDTIVKDYIKKLKVCFFGGFAQNTFIKEVIKVNKKYTSIGDATISPIYSNYSIASIITAYCRIKLYNFMKLLQHENVLLISCNIDSVTVYISEEKINELIIKYPNEKGIFNKRNNYFDLLNINNGVKFFCEEENLPYYNFTGQEINFDDMQKLKKKFFNEEKAFTLNNYKVNFESYYHRVWINNRVNTTSILLNYK